MYSLVAQIVVMPIAIGSGYFADRTIVWRLVFLMHLLIFGSILCFVLSTPEEDHFLTKDDHAPVGMPIGQILINITAGTLVGLN